MKKLIVTMMTIMSVASTAFGQWIPDTVRMGATSINDVFYSLNNGTVKTENNKNNNLAGSKKKNFSSSSQKITTHHGSWLLFGYSVAT